MADKIIFEVVATAKGVKVVQQQTDKLATSTDRADRSTKKLDKTRDAYNRREKGAANISSNQTKNFSKMQQGIDGGGGSGGLVRAYALLAANVFALTAAFGVLSRSAQIDTLTQSMEVLSTTGGTFIKNLAKDMQEASGFAIDLAQAFSQVSLASSAGLSTKEIEGLTAVAKGAAISLGRNLPDAMDRIFRGAIKLEPEILDEIGLFVRVDEAAQKYARNNNKVVSALTQVEKRQAFLNEILEQGTKKFQEYADGIKPDPYVRLGAALADIAQGGLSIFNGVLGPLLSFLAESKVLLTAVFGTLVTVLLKKAIPAMGLMTKNAAELATERADAAKAYSKSITESSDRAIKADIDDLKSARKTNSEKMKMDKRFKSRSTKPGADTTKLDKAKLGSANRLARVEERITVLKKAQNDKDNESQRLIKAELAALTEEERIEKRLLALKKSGGVSTGSLAERRQDKLDSQSRVAGAVSMAAGSMETSGITVGFSDLNEELRTQVKVNDELVDKYTRTEKATARLKGGVSALGIGFNKLMMIMGPAMMIFAVLSPLLIAAGKAMGFGSKEATAYADSLKKLNDQLENFENRLDAQVRGMKNQNLTFTESIKATLAYNKNIADTTARLLESVKAYEEVEEAGRFFPDLWDSMMGGARVQSLLASGQKELNAVLKSAIELNKDDQIANLVGKENVEDVKNYSTAMESFLGDLKLQSGFFRVIRGELKGIDTGFAEIINSARKFGKQGFESYEQVKESGKGYAIGLNKEEQAIFNRALALSKTNKIMTFFGLSVDELKEKGMDLEKATSDQAKRFEILGSALEGANEAVGKFQNQFMPKTKVDDILGSMDALDAALDKMTEKEQIGFLSSVGGDSDNAFGPLFSKLRGEVKLTTAQLDDGSRTIEEFLDQNAWDAVKKEFNDYKETVLLTALETKELTNENKHLNKFLDAGAVIREKLNKNEGKVLKNNLNIAKESTTIMARSFGLTKEDVQENVKGLVLKHKLATTDKERNAVAKELLDLGIDNSKMLQLRGALHNQELADYEQQLHIETKLERLAIQKLKSLQKVTTAQSQYTQELIKELKAQTELTALQERGTLKLSPKEEAEMQAETARLKMTTTVAEAQMKKDMINAETALLRQQMIFYAKRTKDSSMLNDAGTGLNETLENNLTSAAKHMENAYSKVVSTAQTQFQLDLAKIVADGFGEGVYSGILAAQIAAKEARIQERSTMSPEELDKDNKDNPIFTQTDDISFQAFRATSEKMAEDMKKLGPEGELVAAVVQGTFAITDAYKNMQSVMSLTLEEGGTGMAKAAATAEFAAQAIGQIGAMMAAQSTAQVAEVDKQIAAEKKRDGKSAESIAKLKGLEKKKEAMERKAFERDKKMQMARTVASTAAGIMGVMSGVKSPLDAPFALATAAMIGLMGAAQLAIISKTKYGGGASEISQPSMGALSIGKRDNKVDVSRGPSSGELAYMRGARGTGTNANNFTTTGGAYGMRNYAHSGEGILVGEQGPEVIQPTQPVDVIPMGTGGAQNVNFTINAVDADGIETVLENQRGNIIGMIRSAANGYGTRFLEEVDTDVVSSGGYQKA